MDLDTLFTYHAPTAETAPKYGRLRRAEADCQVLIAAVLGGSGARDVEVYGDITAAFRAFAEVIAEVCPDGPDKSAAIRCVRLAHMALNELARGGTSIQPTYGLPEFVKLELIAEQQTLFARWQACAAVALG